MTPETEYLTIAEAAKRLDTTEPRLRRLLQHDKFRPHTRQEERRTRTGTRTATVVSVSVLPELREAIEKGTASRPEPEQKQERSEALALVSVYQALAKEKDARLHQQEREIDHLRNEVEFLRKQLENRILPAPPPETPTTASGDTETTETALGLHSSGEEKTDRTAPIRAWWRFWRQ